MLSCETQEENAPVHKASGQVAADQELGSSTLLTTGDFPGPRSEEAAVFAIKLAGNGPPQG